VGVHEVLGVLQLPRLVAGMGLLGHGPTLAQPSKLWLIPGRGTLYRCERRQRSEQG
jgi:hypothetical protein